MWRRRAPIGPQSVAGVWEDRSAKVSATRWLEERLLAGLERSWGDDRITVLAYHRIGDPVGFEFFEPVISAAPGDFARQMDIVNERFNAVTLTDFLAWVDGKSSLPPNPALITFDDGYRDNLEAALPVLRERGLPAVLFLATDHIGRSQPFFWDSAAYAFRHSDHREADLPIVGPRSWESPDLMCAEWIEAAKRQPQARTLEATQQLHETLDTTMPDSAYAGEILTWDEVRAMAQHGFEFGSHTLTHPILTGLSPAEARRELAESRGRIEAELDQPVRSLAYPNGTPADFDPGIEAMAKACGYTVAFTLVPGPARAREVHSRPLAIRRIAVYLPDGDRRYRAKLAGAGRVKPSLS